MSRTIESSVRRPPLIPSSVRRVKELGTAKLSAAAARHKRKLCAGFFFAIILVMHASPSLLFL